MAKPAVFPHPAGTTTSSGGGNILLTAGPTHEYLDAVRYLGNPSTGATGLAVAAVAAERGHRVRVVLGPTALPDPVEVEVLGNVGPLARLCTGLRAHGFP